MAISQTSGLQSARPTLIVAGQEQPTLTGGLLSLMIVQQTTGLDRCEARFGNWGTVDNNIQFLYFDRRTLDFGKEFRVTLGEQPLFNGKIMGIEAGFPEGAPPEITVLAEDSLQQLRMTRRTRTFADVSDADLCAQIANEHGLSSSVDIAGPTYKVLAQVNQSDLAFLRERARSIGAELWMDGRTLHMAARSARQGQALAMKYGKELRAFTVCADLAMQRTSVTANGWDVASKAALQHEATESAIGNELNGDSAGASILSAALGQRKESLAHTVPLNSADAQAVAESYFRMMARRFVVGRGVAESDARLGAGATVDLQGLGPLFSGKYYVAEVTHLFDGAKGLRTEFRAERPGLGRAQ
jgi:phage protein D